MSRLSPLSLAVGALVLVGLGASGVAVAEALPPSCEPAATAGKASSLVRSPANPLEVGQPPEAFFPTPLKTSGTEISVVQTGSGPVATEGSAIDFQVAVYLGNNGQFITGSSFDPAEPIRRIASTEGVDFFAKALVCQSAGSRIVMTAPLGDVFGPIAEDELVQNSSTVVLVVDVANVYVAEPTGRSMPLTRNLPHVVQAPTGEHGISFPMAPAPEELSVSVLIEGDGPRLADGDNVVVHFTGVSWQSRQVFSTSFEQGVPVTLGLTDGSVEGASGGVISGVYEALLGKSVGSRVIAVIPPEWGYPEGSEPPGAAPGSTLVYVFDILGIE